MKNILKEIEETYPVANIRVDGEQVWPYLRVYYHFKYVDDKVTSDIGEKSIWHDESFLQRYGRIFSKFKNSCYGVENWFAKYDFIAFSDTTERKSIGGKYVNKLLDPMIDELGREKVLYVELPAPLLYPIKQVYTEKIVCRDFLDLLGFLLDRVTPKRYMIQNESILKTIQQKYHLEIDNIELVRYTNYQRRICRLLFQRIKPKAILLTGYYGGNQAAIKAAKDLGIKVIEVQHGVIGKEHAAYNVAVEIDKTSFPDYLLVFGSKDLEAFDNSRFIQPKNVYPVGSFYIEYVKSHKPDFSMAERLKNYGKSIGVTLSWTDERRSIEFVSQAASMDKTIFYILIPRRPQESHYDTMNLPENVAVVKDRNFYELMMYVDFHSTVSSTCALEAPSLGVQNILIDIDGLSKLYYGAVLNDSRVTRYVDTPAEFVNTINTFEKLDRDTVSKLNEHIIATDYRRNIRNFIKQYLQY